MIVEVRAWGLAAGDGWIQSRLFTSATRVTVADGIFGPSTHYAVLSFQKAKGLIADGIVGSKTHEALGTAVSLRPLRQGVRGRAVRQLQRRLEAHGHDNLEVRWVFPASHIEMR